MHALALQQTAGNRAVQARLHAGRAPGAEDPGHLPRDIGPGRPLDAATRAFMEPRFGYDFGHVRLHTNAPSAESAHAVNAVAYTFGRDIVFGASSYAPTAPQGRKLLAHELAHVIQQDRSPFRMVQRAQFAQESEITDVAPRGGTPKEVTAPQPRGGSKAKVCYDIPAPHRLLYWGVFDPAVLEAKRKLNRWHRLEREAGRKGFGAPLAENCDFDGPTSAAVVAFQRRAFPAQPAEWDGRIGDHTWAKLDNVGRVLCCMAALNADHWSKSEHPTTRSEPENVEYWKSRGGIHIVALAKLAADRAVARTLELFPRPQLHHGPGDAFRHSFWNCLMVRSLEPLGSEKGFGSTAAETFATAHENSNPAGAGMDSNMDLHDNFMGRAISGDCEPGCLEALQKGLLRTIRDCPGECIGPSNQPWP